MVSSTSKVLPHNIPYRSIYYMTPKLPHMKEANWGFADPCNPPYLVGFLALWHQHHLGSQSSLAKSGGIGRLANIGFRILTKSFEDGPFTSKQIEGYNILRSSLKEFFMFKIHTLKQKLHIQTLYGQALGIWPSPPKIRLWSGLHSQQDGPSDEESSKPLNELWNHIPKPYY